jgi:putative exporter of polyketide antibiotics
MGDDWIYFLVFAVLQSMMITISSIYLNKKLKEGLTSLKERKARRESEQKVNKKTPLFSIKHNLSKKTTPSQQEANDAIAQ